MSEEVRELTEEEKRIYQKNCDAQREDRRSLLFSVKYETLMLEEGNYHNYLERQKLTRAKLENYKAQLEACEMAINDCEDKLKNGVKIRKEE